MGNDVENRAEHFAEQLSSPLTNTADDSPEAGLLEQQATENFFTAAADFENLGMGSHSGVREAAASNRSAESFNVPVATERTLGGRSINMTLPKVPMHEFDKLGETSCSDMRAESFKRQRSALRGTGPDLRTSSVNSRSFKKSVYFGEPGSELMKMPTTRFSSDKMSGRLAGSGSGRLGVELVADDGVGESAPSKFVSAAKALIMKNKMSSTSIGFRATGFSQNAPKTRRSSRSGNSSMLEGSGSRGNSVNAKSMGGSGWGDLDDDPLGGAKCVGSSSMMRGAGATQRWRSMRSMLKSGADEDRKDSQDGPPPSVGSSTHLLRESVRPSAIQNPGVRWTQIPTHSQEKHTTSTHNKTSRDGDEKPEGVLSEARRPRGDSVLDVFSPTSTLAPNSPAVDYPDGAAPIKPDLNRTMSRADKLKKKKQQ